MILIAFTYKKQVSWTDWADGRVLLIESNQNYILFYTDKNLLYINNQSGRRCVIPLVVNNLAYLNVNKKNDIFLFKASGDLKVTNINDLNLDFNKNSL